MSLQDRVSATIGSIYDAALDRGEWMTALRQVSDLLAGTRATLKLQSAADVRLIADTVGANGREDYRSYYRHIEPVLISMLRVHLASTTAGASYRSASYSDRNSTMIGVVATMWPFFRR
jgi:hypothetical protein